MSFSEINALRKKGDLQSAYDMAHSELLRNPEDLWIKRALMWVLYDLMKDNDDIAALLEEVVDLNLQADQEGMFFEKLVWMIGKNIAAVRNNVEYVDHVAKIIGNLNFPPSNGYSYLLKAFHKHKGEWGGYLEFCDWWDLEKLQNEDYNPFRTESGTEIMALAEQVYIAYAKLLLQTEDNEKIREFIPKIERLGNEHPKYKYPPYFIAKLYQKVGDHDNALKVILPFIRKQSNDYWVWQTLGDICTDEELRFSCYSKALTCKCKPEMLVSIKEAYANMLASRGLYNEAKTEFSQVIGIRQSHSWRVPESLLRHQSESWYSESSVMPNNEACYNKYKSAAEELMLDGLIRISFMIVGLNQEKKIANFITPERRSGVFIYARFFRKAPSLGSCYEGYFSEYSEDGFAKAVRISTSSDPVWDALKCEFSGILRMGPSKKFGIVDCSGKQVFVPRTLLAGLDELDRVKGVAVASYDKTKKRDGWTALAISK